MSKQSNSNNHGQTCPTPADYDGGWKALIRTFWREMLQRAIPDLYAAADLTREAVPLDKELQDSLSFPQTDTQVAAKFVDTLLKVALRDGGEQWVLLHVEVQGSGGEDLPWRMMRYSCLLIAHYNRTPVALAILTEARPHRETAGVYDFRQYGTHHHYAYNSLALHKLDDAELRASNNPFELALYAGKKAMSCKHDEKRKLGYLLELTRLLAVKGWKRQERSDILAFVMRVINLRDRGLWEQYKREARHIKGKGGMEAVSMFEQECIERGIERGRAEGRAEGRADSVRQLLRQGLLSPEQIAQAFNMSLDAVLALGTADSRH